MFQECFYEGKVAFKCITSLENNPQFTKFNMFTQSFSPVLELGPLIRTYTPRSYYCSYSLVPFYLTLP